MSKTEEYDKTLCKFWHRGTSSDILHNCYTTNKERETQEIVGKSGNVNWAICLADVLSLGDLLSLIILYHNRCRTKYWEIFIQRPSRNAHAQGRQPETSHTVTNTTLITAEVQFFYTPSK